MPEHEKSVLQNNLGTKCSLVMKFGQFISYNKKYFYQKILQKNMAFKLIPDSCVYKELMNNYYVLIGK